MKQIFPLLTVLCLQLPLQLVAVGLAADKISGLIPSRFPAGARDISLYTVRYLSQSNGSADTEACLTNATSQSGGIHYCRTIRYGLTGSSTGTNFSNINNLILVVSAGRPYSMSENGIDLSESSSIIIAKDPLDPGDVNFRCAKYDLYNFNNFYWQNVENIALLGITFSHCGPRSTAVTMNMGNYFIVENCTFRNNFNSGLQVNFLSNNLFFINDVFENNMDISIYNESVDLNIFFRHGGGLSIAFSNRTSGSALIQNCTFIRNNASVNEVNLEDAFLRPRLYTPRGHGGALLLSFQNTVGHKVDIRNCIFSNNSAMFTGGAIAIQFFSQPNEANRTYISNISSNNTVLIENVVFRDNNCSLDGGAISATAYEAANYNEIIVVSCTFEGNSAKEGGAYSFAIQDNIINDEKDIFSNVVTIHGSSFTRNSALSGGSAVTLVSNARVEQGTTTTNISDCSFIGNMAGINSALVSLRYPVSLQGTNLFQGNEGGAITLLQTEIYVSGRVDFIENRAVDGGAINMLDYSALLLHDGVEMMFLRNNASNHGGAIKAASSPLVGDINDYYIIYRTCFFQNSQKTITSITDWNVYISFIDNFAGNDGAAIYATDIAGCTRRRQTLKKDNDNPIANYYNDSIFKEEPPFYFRNNRVQNMMPPKELERIATEPSLLSVTPEKAQGAPGETLYFHLNALDQSGNQQPALWAVNFREGLFSLNAKGNKTHPYVVEVEDTDMQDVCLLPFEEDGKNLEVLQRKELLFTLIRTATGDVADTAMVNLIITCCNPGYQLVNDTCEFKVDNSLAGLALRPHGDKKYFYIQPQFYARVENSSIVWGIVPAIYVSCQKQGMLAGCLFKYDNHDAQCANNRTGFLCGKCPAGKELDLTLSCVDCKKWHSFLIAAIVLAFAIACTLVMMYNISVPNELRGFLFYFQVVGFVYNYTGNNITWDFHLSNMFGFSLYVPLCPSPGYDALSTVAFGFILPFVAVFTIVGYIIGARFIKRLSNKNSFDGIWFLTFIIYKFIADTCVRILRCQKVDQSNGGTARYVYYYDGDIECYTIDVRARTGFAIVSLIFGAMIILFPIFILVISFKRFQFTMNITDILNKDLKTSCRWWASFDLFRRLLFITVVVIFSTTWPLYTQLALLYCSIFVFFTFACAQPYASRKANISEAAVLLNLILISALFLNVNGAGVRSLALLLLLIPFISAAIYLIYKVTALLWDKFSPLTLKASCYALLCKLMNKIGVQSPFKTNVECVSYHRPPLLKELSTPFMDDDDISFGDPLPVDDEFRSQYAEYREELLED